MAELSEDQQRWGNRGELIPDDYEELPDSSHLSGLCPRCGKQSTFRSMGFLSVTYDNTYIAERDGSETPEDLDRVSVLHCHYCRQNTVVIEEQWIGDHVARERKGSGYISYRGIYWWPLPEAYSSKDIPENIASAFTETSTTLYARCPRAAVVMARRTLEAVTVDKGETTGTLFDRLKKLTSLGILPPLMADWAQEVRKIGNTGAHYDPLEQASMDEARELVRYLRELLRYLYEMPAELQRRRAKRESSQGQP